MLDQQSGNPVFDDLAVPSNIGRDHRKARRTRFKQCNRVALGAGRKGEHVQSRQQEWNVGPIPDKPYPPLECKLGGQALERLALFTLANDDQE